MGHGFIPMLGAGLMRWCGLFFVLMGSICVGAAPTTMPSTRPAGIAIANVAHPAPVDFQKEVLPILASNCLACHNKTKAKAGLILETPSVHLQGCDIGPAVYTKKIAATMSHIESVHLERI